MPSERDLSHILKMWKIPQEFKEELKESCEGVRLKHGKLASIPLVCRTDQCPFRETCSIKDEYRIKGSRCLMEIGTIVTRFDELCNHFSISIDGDYIQEKDVVDVAMIRDIIDLEIQLLRADNKIAISSDFMQKHIAQVDKKGNAYYEEIINPAAEFKLKLSDNRMKLFSKLNATRKDKADLFKSTESYTNKALSIIEKIKEKAKDLNIDNMEEVNNSLGEFNSLDGDV